MIKELPKIETAAYRPDRDREAVRSGLAYLIIVVFIAIVVAMAIQSLFFSESGGPNSGKVVRETIFPAIIGLAAAVMGFYYGTKSD